MLTFQEEKMQKAAENILQYTEVLAATYEGVRSDLLVAAIWYCLKEDQKKVQRLEEALKIQNDVEPVHIVSSKSPAKDPRRDSVQKRLNGSKNVSTIENSSRSKTNRCPEVITMKVASKSKPTTVNEGKKPMSDSDICVIEIDDDDDEDDGKKKTADNTPIKTVNKVTKVKETDNIKKRKSESTELSTQKPLRTLPAPVQLKKDQNKQTASNKNIPISTGRIEEDKKCELKTVKPSEHEELFDMDCEEIQDEQEPPCNINSDKKPDKIIKPSEKVNAVKKGITIISDEEDAGNSEEEKTESPQKTLNKTESKKKKVSAKKGKMETNKNEEKIGEINVIMDDETDVQGSPTKSASFTDTDAKTSSENTVGDKTEQDTDNSEQVPFPTALTQNIANQTAVALPETNETVINQIDNSVEVQNSQNYTSVLSQDQDFHDATVNMNSNINSDHYSVVSQNTVNPNEVNISGPADDGGPYICPNSGIIGNIGSKEQYFHHPQNASSTLAKIKTEIDPDSVQNTCIAPPPTQGLIPIQGMHALAPTVTHQGVHAIASPSALHPVIQGMAPPGHEVMAVPQRVHGIAPPQVVHQSIQGMASQQVQGMSSQNVLIRPDATGSLGYIDPSFSRQPYVPVNTDPLSLTSLATGALTYPYRSTETAPGLYGPRQLQGPAGYFDPVLQHQLAVQHIPGLDATDQGRKRGKPGASLSPPTKKRLLDFDRKWHEGPSSSKGQERYIALPSNAMKTAQSPWNEGQTKITEMEWAMRFNSYRSISNNIPPPFVGADVTQNIVQSEIVGVSLDDIGFHEQAEDSSEREYTEENDRPKRGNSRGRGRAAVRGRGRGRWSRFSRGRGQVLKGTNIVTEKEKSSETTSATTESPGSPHGQSPVRSRGFSFFRRGRLGFAQTRARARGKGPVGISVASVAEAVKTSGRHQAVVANSKSKGASRGRSVRFGRRGRRGRTRSKS